MGPDLAKIFGAQELRNIENLELRSNLGRVMAFDYDLVNLSAEATPCGHYVTAP